MSNALILWLAIDLIQWGEQCSFENSIICKGILGGGPVVYMAPAQSQYVLQQAEGDAIEYMGRTCASFLHTIRLGLAKIHSVQMTFPVMCVLDVMPSKTTLCTVQCNFWPISREKEQIGLQLNAITWIHTKAL